MSKINEKKEKKEKKSIVNLDISCIVDSINNKNKPLAGENGCNFIIPNKIAFIIDLENLNPGGLEHCDVLLLNKDTLYFIELKNTSNTHNIDTIDDSIISSIVPKYNGTKNMAERVLNVLDKNVFKLENIKKVYVFFIDKDTLQLIKHTKALYNKEIFRILQGMKELEDFYFKPCGDNLYRDETAF